MPLVVQNGSSGELTTLNNTADYSDQLASCPLRYVLSDDLTRLCADLAYSKGARTVACADLLRIPAETLWMEWCNGEWQSALQRYGFPVIEGGHQSAGRRGALLKSSRDGRRGVLRTFWNREATTDVLASSVEAFFDFDNQDGEEPATPVHDQRQTITVYDPERSGDDVLARCFRFRYERTWSDYYLRAGLTDSQRAAVWRHALGTIAMDVPMLLAFLLLLATRTGLPQRPQSLERLNRLRRKSGRAPLLDHIEVRSPLLPEYRDGGRTHHWTARRGPRLHHVRGHLVRRGGQLFWRVPHLRGSARSGVLRTRTVVWTVDAPAS
jgi:hypothetical protein